MVKRSVLLVLLIIICAVEPANDVRAQTSMPRHAAGVIAWNPDNTRIALGYGTGMIRIFDSSSGALLREIQAYDKSITGLAWGPADTPYENQLLSGAHGSTVHIWDTTTGEVLKSFETSALVHEVAWSPDGNQVLAATSNQYDLPYTMYVWDTSTAALLHDPGGFIVYQMKWSLNGQYLASNLLFGEVSIWDTLTYEGLAVVGEMQERSLINLGDHVFSVAWSPDSQLLAFGKVNGQVEIWEPFPVPRRVLGPLYANDLGGDDWFLRTVVDLSFSPDGQRLQAISGEGTIRVWDATTGELVSEEDLDEVIYNAAWNADGTRLAYNGEQTPLLVIMPDSHNN